MGHEVVDGHTASQDEVPQHANASATADAYYAGSGVVDAVGPVSYERQELRARLTPDAHGVVIVMVGLPARGKSFISRKVERFLQWRGFSTRMFNVGKYRRDAVGPEESGRSNFYDSGNAVAMAARDRAAAAALADALAFLDGGGKFAILDATNSTRERRKRMADAVQAHRSTYSLILVEAICDDVAIVEANIRGKALNSPDFKHMPLEAAVADLRARIAKYEEVYQTVEDGEGASIKLFNLSSKVMANHCYGRVAKSILPYLMAIHIGARPIWLMRACSGQATAESNGYSDRMSTLSPEGRSFATGLAAFIRRRTAQYWTSIGKPQESTHILTSTMPRAVASVCYTTLRHEQTSALNPVDKGAIGVGWWDVECPTDKPPWQDLARYNPDFFAQWEKDPVNCRFPGGESYMDVIRRLEGLLIEVEMITKPVLIVSHVTVLQLLVAYFRGVPVEQAWKLSVPKNTVIEVTPTTGGGFVCEEHALQLEVEGAAAPSDDGPCLQKEGRMGTTLREAATVKRRKQEA